MTLVDKASEAESRLKRPEFPWITGFQNFRCFAESKNITIPSIALPKLYIPSSLNTALTLSFTMDCGCIEMFKYGLHPLYCLIFQLIC